MSNRNKTKKYRGPSRAIDPRRAPGRPAQRGPDRFGYTLIAIGLAFVLVLIVVASIVQSNSATPTTTGQVPASNDPAAQAAATSVAATAAEVAFATQVTSLPTISPTDAQSLLAANNAKFVDVRATSQYDISHIQGASNVPYTDAQNRLSEFPKSGNLIIYCQ